MPCRVAKPCEPSERPPCGNLQPIINTSGALRSCRPSSPCYESGVSGGDLECKHPRGERRPLIALQTRSVHFTDVDASRTPIIPSGCRTHRTAGMLVLLLLLLCRVGLSILANQEDDPVRKPPSHHQHVRCPAFLSSLLIPPREWCLRRRPGVQAPPSRTPATDRITEPVPCISKTTTRRHVDHSTGTMHSSPLEPAPPKR